MELISTAEAAALAGVRPGTCRDYVSKGLAPQPIVRGFYDRAEVEEWLANRPGRGARTDLQPDPPEQESP